MATLNADCWRIVFDLLEPETRALYHCLFVSKEFFTFSTRVAYRRPLEVSEGQRAYSPFSRHRLGNILDLCSGFTTTRGGHHQQQTSSSSSPTSSSTTIPLIHPLHDYSPSLDIIPATGLPLTLPATINYYNLVLEYPGSINIRENISKWIPFLICYAETIPALELSVRGFDIILPLVTRFRALNSLIISLPPLLAVSTLKGTAQYTSSPAYLDKMIQFIQTHNSLFSGRLKLKILETSDKQERWSELMAIQEAIGGTTEQSITMNPTFENDLDGLIVSRLKVLNLTFRAARDGGKVPKGLDIKVMNLLKRCIWLETLELGWPAEAALDWSSFMVLQNSGQRTVGQDQNRCIGLKHLVVQENIIMAVQVMQAFKDTLETVEISKYIPGPRRFASRQVLVSVDWKSLFVLPKLKSIELDRVSFVFENLCCCPVLESLVLHGERWDSKVIEKRNPWPESAAEMLPITLRTLGLHDYGTDRFDFLSLNHLVNLEKFYITSTKLNVDVVNKNSNNTNHLWPLMDFSKKDCYFPKLRHVAVFGKLAVQIQGQILWVAPRLEYFSLDLRFVNAPEGDLRMDTFLYPPSELKSTPVYTSRASFPELKHFALTSSAFASLESSKRLADVFFSRRSDLKLLENGSGTIDDSDGEAMDGKKVESNKINGIDSEDERAMNNTKDENNNDNNDNINNNNDNNNGKGFPFPNLEQLDLYMYIHLDCIEQLLVRPMRNLPRLHHLWCRGLMDQYLHNDQLTKWFQQVPQDSRGSQHVNYKYRPKAQVTASSSTTTSTPLSGVVGASGDGTQEESNCRCVLELGLSFSLGMFIRHQLKVPYPSIID